MSGSYASLYYHLVFSTKDRQPLLTPDIAPRIYEYMGGIIRDMGGDSVIVGGAIDHAHLLSSLSKTITVAEALRNLKAGTSKWIHSTFPSLKYFAWQEGYGAFSISVSGLETVKRYILTQEEHHHTTTFQEEFLSFLDRHSIAYDERYIWK